MTEPQCGVSSNAPPPVDDRGDPIHRDLDLDAVLPRSVAFKRLQSVARKRSEVGQALSGLQPVEPYFRLSHETGKLPDSFPGGEASGSPVAEACDHARETI